LIARRVEVFSEEGDETRQGKRRPKKGGTAIVNGIRCMQARSSGQSEKGKRDVYDHLAHLSQQQREKKEKRIVGEKKLFPRQRQERGRCGTKGPITMAENKKIPLPD